MQNVSARGRSLWILAVILILVVTLLAVGVFHQGGPKPKPDLCGGTSLRFWLDVSRARAQGSILSDQSDAEVVADTLRVIGERIRGSGLEGVEVLALAENRFEIAFPASLDGALEEIVGLATTLGQLSFRIEVLPDERYHDPGSEDSPHRRVRFKVWPASAEEFDVFKAAEVAAWQAAQAGGTAYIPTQSPFRVVPKRSTATWRGADAFAVIEDPAREDERFDGSMLENVHVARGAVGQPVTAFDVKSRFRGAFETWTGRNVGLPMAILLNGEYTTAPVIRQPLLDSVQITLGYRNLEDARKEAEGLGAVLQGGSLKLRPVLESRTRIGAR